MKIVNKTKQELDLKFEDLNIGDVFCITSPVVELLPRMKLINTRHINLNSEFFYNCLNLKINTQEYIGHAVPVKKLNVELHILPDEDSK